jgi:hypothetical protein
VAKEGASGTIELPVGDLGAVKPSRWYPVCSVGDLGSNKPISRTVRVRVGKTAYSDVLYQASLYAGVWWQPESDFSAWYGNDHPYCGVIRFEYGSQGFQRTIYCDLRSGEYQIPSCEFLRVTATRYTPAVDISGEFPYEVDRASWQIEGEIADGVAADFTPMIFTAPSTWGDADPDEYVKVAAPPGAYAFEVSPVSSNESTGNRFQTIEPASVRDFENSVWIPPSSPLPLLEAFVQIASDLPSVRQVRLVFFVR